MEKAHLSFQLKSRHIERYDFDAHNEYSAAFSHALGLKIDCGSWSGIELDSPVFGEFIQQARTRILNDDAIFYGLNGLGIYLDDTEPAEWYELYARAQSVETDEDADGIITCKAYQMPPMAHTAQSYYQFVSEKFVSVIQRYGFTGIDFVWVKDTGKYRSQQWFIPVPLMPLGRGVDHPWYQPPPPQQDIDMNSGQINWRSGVWRFNLHELKRDIVATPAYHDIFNLYRLSEAKSADQDFPLTILAYKVYLRAFLPPVDFAYIWDNGWNGKRKFCISRRASEILMTEGVVTRHELAPIKIVDELPAGCQQLDGIGLMPPSNYTPNQLAVLKPLLAKEWAKFQATEKPIRSVKLKEVLTLLRQTKRKRPADFHKPAKASIIGSLPITLPANWLAILAITDGGRLDVECLLHDAGSIVKAWQELSVSVSRLFDDPPFEKPLIPIADSASGDWYGLEETGGGDDTRVLCVSHEDWSVLNIWDNIPQFVFDMLTGFYD